MSERTKIEWCDSTWNPWRGCTKVSAGCANCYADRLCNRFGIKFGRGELRVMSKPATFNAPLRWNKKPWVCDECGRFFQHWDGAPHCCGTHPRRLRVFLGSLMDIFDPEIPAEWLARALDVVRRCDQLDWLLVTKRPELFVTRLSSAFEWWAGKDANHYSWIADWATGEAPHNVTVLASVENQEMADKRIPELLRIPARRHGLSIEPLLGPVDLTRLYWPDMHGGKKFENCLVDNISDDAKKRFPGMKWPETVKWVIVGGESGPNARPCTVEWIRGIVQQCKEPGVPCFVKQLGANSYVPAPYGPITNPKGADPAEWPEDLRVRKSVETK